MFKKRSLRSRHNTMLLFEGMEDIEYIVFDTETTGLNNKIDYIVQISAVKYKIKNGNPEKIDVLDLYIKPPFYMDESVIAVHHISNEFLEDKPSEKEVFDKIKDFFGYSPIVVGYNPSFDIGMMNAMYERLGSQFQYTVSLDVLEMARDIVEESEDYKLATISKLYGIDELSFHNSIEDVKATAQLLHIFYKEYKKMAEKPLNTLYINYIHFWSGHRREQKGVYVDTNAGKVWFSTYLKCWCSSSVDLSAYDITSFEKEVLKKISCSYDELCHMTEKKMKERMKPRNEK